MVFISSGAVLDMRDSDGLNAVNVKGRGCGSIISVCQIQGHGIGSTGDRRIIDVQRCSFHTINSCQLGCRSGSQTCLNRHTGCQVVEGQCLITVNREQGQPGCIHEVYSTCTSRFLYADGFNTTGIEGKVCRVGQQY